jgi:excisionase family DNA binding protein
MWPLRMKLRKPCTTLAISQKEFLTVDEACQLINASRWTIYRLIDKGELKAGKLGRSTRIPRTAINELFKLTEA